MEVQLNPVQGHEEVIKSRAQLSVIWDCNLLSGWVYELNVASYLIVEIITYPGKSFYYIIPGQYRKLRHSVLLTLQHLQEWFHCAF